MFIIKNRTCGWNERQRGMKEATHPHQRPILQIMLCRRLGPSLHPELLLSTQYDPQKINVSPNPFTFLKESK